MDFRVLQYFTVVARELNFTKAAEKLHMSQPPLSNQIRLLEEDLGFPLFIRGKRHLTLTEEGSFFLSRANQILELADKTRYELSGMKDGLSGRISISQVNGRAPYLTARWIAGFRDEFPNVHFEIRNGSSDDVFDHVKRGLADVAVVAKPYNSEEYHHLTVGREPWVAIISREHPLAALPGNTIPMASLKDVPLIVPRRQSRVVEIQEWFRDLGFEPDIICEVSGYLDAVALAEQNAGIAIFPQTTYTPNELVVTKMLTEPSRIAEYVLIWEKGKPMSILVEEFINYARDFIEENKIMTERFRVKGELFDLPEEEEAKNAKTKKS